MSARQAGFTLVEVLLAVAITAGVITAVTITFDHTYRAKMSVDDMQSTTSVGPRVLALLERDLAGLWHHNVRDNKIFVGRNMDIGGLNADRIDFLSTTDSIGYVTDSDDRQHHPTYTEVGYWLRPHPRLSEFMELWRREDPMIDDDILRGGKFQLVTDRIKEFSITYYETLGYEAEEKLEWDTGEKHALPRRMKIEFVVEPRRGNRNDERAWELADDELLEQRFIRHFVFDRRYMTVLDPGTAMVPVIPQGPPDEANEGGGPGGPGPAGPGPAGPGPGASEGEGPNVTQTRVPGGTRGEGGRGGRGDAGGRGPGARGNGLGGQGGGGRGAPSFPGGGQGLPPGFNLGDLLSGVR